MINVTSTFVSFFFPFTNPIQIALPPKDDSLPSSTSSSVVSSPRISRRQLSTRVPLSTDTETPAVAPSPPTRKGSWLSRPPRNERRQSCRRVHSSRRRDWSNELEESEFHVTPFPVASHDYERGGTPVVRTVSFREEMRDRVFRRPRRIDTMFVEQGLMIDVDSEEIEEPTSATGTENTTDTDTTKDSEWTSLSEHAEGIEMYF